MDSPRESVVGGAGPASAASKEQAANKAPMVYICGGKTFVHILDSLALIFMIFDHQFHRHSY